jgi:hypothetical protein
MLKKSARKTRKTLKKKSGGSIPPLPNSPRPEPEVKACVEVLQKLLPNVRDYAGLVITKDSTIDHAENNYTKFIQYNYATAAALPTDECIALKNLCDKIVEGKIIIKPSIDEQARDLLKSRPATIAYFDKNKNFVITRERFILNFKRTQTPILPK